MEKELKEKCQETNKTSATTSQGGAVSTLKEDFTLCGFPVYSIKYHPGCFCGSLTIAEDCFLDYIPMSSNAVERTFNEKISDATEKIMEMKRTCKGSGREDSRKSVGEVASDLLRSLARQLPDLRRLESIKTIQSKSFGGLTEEVEKEYLELRETCAKKEADHIRSVADSLDGGKDFFPCDFAVISPSAADFIYAEASKKMSEEILGLFGIPRYCLTAPASENLSMQKEPTELEVDVKKDEKGLSINDIRREFGLVELRDEGYNKIITDKGRIGIEREVAEYEKNLLTPENVYHPSKHEENLFTSITDNLSKAVDESWEKVPIEECPQGHHKLDGDCMYDFCRCTCPRCAAQCEKHGR